MKYSLVQLQELDFYSFSALETLEFLLFVDMLFSFFLQLAFLVVIAGALRCACIFAPFIAFQAYGYQNICVGRSHDELRPWCKARVPLLYNYIQSHYW